MITVSLTGKRDRRQALVQAAAAGVSDGHYRLQDKNANPPIVGEVFNEQLTFIADRFGKGETRKYSLCPSPDAATPFAFRQDDRSVSVYHGDTLVMSYVFDERLPRPFINPLMVAGINILRTVGTDQTVDHPHHRGILLAHGALNGIDFWNEPAAGGFGRVRQTSLAVAAGPLSARIATGNIWLGPNGGEVMRDRRVIRIYATAADHVVVDVDCVLSAAADPVEIGCTKEAGFLSVRMHPELAEKGTGVIRNCYGGVGMAECWGKPAQWVDYSGVVNGQPRGLAIFDRPGNLRYPTRWHVRDYGLFAPSTWYDRWGMTPHRLAIGDSLAYRWRLIGHTDTFDRAAVADAFLDVDPGPDVAVARSES